MRIASIDIGTNTFRLLVSEADGGKFIKKLYISREITRLGEGLTPEKMLINPNAIDRSLNALSGFSLKLKEYDVSKLRAVATSAVRESLNGLDFVKKVEAETGIPVEVISGDEEARLTVEGVLNSVGFDTPDCLIFDIGGGSTEYVYVKEGEIANIASTGLGVVRLTEKYLKGETDTEPDIALLSGHIHETIVDGLSSFPAAAGDKITLIGTAGTPTTLAAMELRLAKYDPVLVNNFILTSGMIESTLQTILSVPRFERTKIPGLEKGREDLIVSGIARVQKTMERFSSDRLVVSDAGLLEGIAYNMIGREGGMEARG
ncbi:MAG: Ppx/GppA family phosphatase [Candidatus Dadabacteria bacterium]|nr:Ppx/GppA family phosphatase [Candidatus Dadabacteria bacterium]